MIKKNFIGNTNLSLTELGVGTAPIGGWPYFVESQKAEEVLQESWDGGVRYFDTAPFYGYGSSEERLGKFLKNKNRDEFVVSTKVGRIIIDSNDKSKFTLFVIEVNPRSSRTIPFISKVTGVPMVKLATRIMLNEKLSNLDYGVGLRDNLNLFAVKAPVFSMSKLSGVDTFLGPEMKSTGEVMGIDQDFHVAIKKAFISKGIEINNQTPFLLSIADRDKNEATGFIKQLVENGNQLFATEGTYKFIKSLGYEVIMVNKILSRSNTVLDIIDEGKVGAILNTVTGDRASLQDGYYIRRRATESNIPCYTSIDTAIASVMAISDEKINAKAINDYY